MKVKDIFAEENSLLYTVQYDNDERTSLEITYDELTDTEHLRSFFIQFKQDFEGYYGPLKLNAVVLDTIDDADKLFSELVELAESKDHDSLNELFKPLDNRENEDESYPFQQLKSYGNKAPWIRVYVVRFGKAFVFTGGTIKLTQYMKQRAHTKHELYKLNIVRDYLKEEGEEGELGYIELKQDD
jgi:hypothetical protein